MANKICKKCNIPKDLDCFYKERKTTGYVWVRNTCKSCDNIKSINWVKKNPESQKDIRNKYNNSEKGKLKSREYTKNNLLKIAEYQKDYYKDPLKRKRKQKQIIKNHKKRLKTDIQYKLLESLRNRLYRTTIKKDKSAKDLLGCSIKEYRTHLEQQFLPEMNWDNYGSIWEIDHIKPCSSFNLEILDEQQECFHYTNLQPLFTTTKIALSLGYKNYIGNRNKLKKYE